ncbi:MAG: 30S ribosomal protein S7 [Patescibacteria group bacterium]
MAINKVKKREIKSDPKYNSIVLEKFINHVMKCGKKETARRIVYDALALAEQKIKKPPMEIFSKVLKNISPQVEVKSRRVGGANYQVPCPVTGERKKFLAMIWILQAIKSKKGKSAIQKIADEFIAAYNEEGEAIKIKHNVERMAEANRAFAYLSW